MRLRARWSSVITLVVLVFATSASLTACGAADPYTGTWLGPTPEPGSQRFELTITKTNDTFWSVHFGSSQSHPIDMAKVGDELQTGDGSIRLKVDGDALMMIESIAPDDPHILTRQ